MEPLLLVLILASGPHHEDLEGHLSQLLAAAGGDKVHVEVGDDALKDLESRGVKDLDLVASPTIGDHLTAADPHLMIIRCERSEAGGDEMIESCVWAHGHDNRHVAIAGKDADPSNGAINGILGLAAPWLPDHAGDGNPDLDARYAHLADLDDWTALADATATADPPTARSCYYRVLALVHLDRKADAQAVYQRMRTDWPAHILTSSAASLVAPPPSTADVIVDDGSNRLSDGSASAAEEAGGGNTMHEVPASEPAPASEAAPATAPEPASVTVPASASATAPASASASASASAPVPESATATPASAATPAAPR
jgi:hypothetical protein